MNLGVNGSNPFLKQMIELKGVGGSLPTPVSKMDASVTLPKMGGQDSVVLSTKSVLGTPPLDLVFEGKAQKAFADVEAGFAKPLSGPVSLALSKGIPDEAIKASQAESTLRNTWIAEGPIPPELFADAGIAPPSIG